MSRRTARRLVRVVAAVVLATAGSTALASCQQEQVGAAAVVGDDTISVQELQDATQDFLGVVPDADPGDAQHDILQRMLVSAVFADTAETLGVSVSDGEVAQQRDQILTSIQPQARQADMSSRDYLVTQLSQGAQPTTVPPSQIDDWVRDQILVQRITEAAAAAAGADPGSDEGGAAANDAVIAASRGLDIEVNPRYGEWNPRTGVVPQVGGGLSETVDELAARDADQK